MDVTLFNEFSEDCIFIFLIEFSFLTAPHNYLETIFQLQLKGYKVILAHAERYPYLTESDLEDFINLSLIHISEPTRPY